MNIETYYSFLIYFFTALIGLCVGSFLNVVIYRVPLKMSVAFPASHCPDCNYSLKWYDNIPVLSYLILGGKCRNCKKHISFRYTAVEISNMLLWLLAVWCFKDRSFIYSVLTALAFSVCICIFFIDFEHLLIFDRFQIIFLALGIAVTVIDFFDKTADTSIFSHIIGLVSGFLLFFLISVCAEKILGREALGGGDIKLFAVMGLFLGWEKLLFALLISSLLASIVLLLIQKKKNENGKEYPFGPFLVFGFTVSLLFGENIINWYLSFLI